MFSSFGKYTTFAIGLLIPWIAHSESELTAGEFSSQCRKNTELCYEHFSALRQAYDVYNANLIPYAGKYSKALSSQQEYERSILYREYIKQVIDKCYLFIMVKEDYPEILQNLDSYLKSNVSSKNLPATKVLHEFLRLKYNCAAIAEVNPAGGPEQVDKHLKAWWDEFTLTDSKF